MYVEKKGSGAQKGTTDIKIPFQDPSICYKNIAPSRALLRPETPKTGKKVVQ
jgi:hypothetical protein